MSSARLIRPFARAFQRPIARASLSTKSIAPFTPSVTAQLQGKTQKKATPPPAPEVNGIPMDKMRILQAAMPQLVPFYFVNEVATAFIIFPTLIYIFSKYILPKRVRMMCARVFISKL